MFTGVGGQDSGSLVTTGTLTPSEPSTLGEVTGRYKQCESRSRMRRWPGADDLVFRGLSIFHVRHPLKSQLKNTELES